jgi:RNA polymerase sigma factor, sigma-70 family
MSDFIFEKKYLEMISYLISKYPKYIRDDLRQELLMKLYKMLTTEKDMYNQENYIFISLKNHAIDVYKKELRNTHISLNQKISIDSEKLDFVVDKSTTNEKDYFFNSYDYKKIFNQLLTNKEKHILEEYIFHHTKQKELAETYHTSQQNISKIIKKALNKIKNYIN